jgi:hypothetical protein
MMDKLSSVQTAPIVESNRQCLSLLKRLATRDDRTALRVANEWFAPNHIAVDAVLFAVRMFGACARTALTDVKSPLERRPIEIHV